MCQICSLALSRGTPSTGAALARPPLGRPVNFTLSQLTAQVLASQTTPPFPKTELPKKLSC